MFLMSSTCVSSSQFCPSLFLPLPHVFNLRSPFSLSWLLRALSASFVRHRWLHFFSFFLWFGWCNRKSPSVFGPTPTQEQSQIPQLTNQIKGGVWYSKDPIKKKKTMKAQIEREAKFLLRSHGAENYDISRRIDLLYLFISYLEHNIT